MKKFILFLFTLVIGFAVFCGFYVKADPAPTVILQESAEIRTSGDYGLKFLASIEGSFEENTAHGFYLAIGRHTKDEMVDAIVANTGQINGHKLLRKATNGSDKDFAVTIIEMPEANVVTEITAIAFIVVDETNVYSDIAVSKNIITVAKEKVDAGSTNEAIIELANRRKIEIIDSSSNIFYHSDYYENGSQIDIKAGDTINLSSNTFSNQLVINQSNVKVYGANKDKAMDSSGDRIEGTTETIIDSSIIVKNGCDNVEINGLTIKGSLMDDANPATNAWFYNSEATDSDTRLAATSNQFGAGIVLLDSHNDVSIKYNKFSMINNSKYAVVDNCEENVTIEDEVITEFKFNNNKNKNLDVSYNYIDFSAHTSYTCDIFFRGYVYNSNISNNYFKNNYSTSSKTFSYDFVIRLWRIGNSSTNNTTLNINNNVLNHTKTNIAVDLGFAANVVKTTTTININSNKFGDYSRRGIRVAYTKAGTTVNITGNEMDISSESTANYSILVSGTKSKTATTNVQPTLNISNNAFKGVVKLQFGFKTVGSYTIENNFYNNGSANVTCDGTITSDMLTAASVDIASGEYATYEAWVAAQ